MRYLCVIFFLSLSFSLPVAAQVVSAGLGRVRKGNQIGWQRRQMHLYVKYFSVSTVEWGLFVIHTTVCLNKNPISGLHYLLVYLNR